MKILAWNCRGLGNPRTVRYLNLLVKEKSPTMIFLMETKCMKVRIEEVCNMLGYDGCLVVDSRGSSGGLTFLWKTRDKVSIYNYSRWHISAMVGMGMEQPWLFTGFYGNPETSKRHLSWDFLKSIKPDDSTPWMCCGDFNEIVCQDEKMGGGPRPYNQMEIFRNTLEWCSLSSLVTKGPCFTWANNREQDSFIKERLDRALANPMWLERYQESSCCVLPTMTSDHCPVLIDVIYQQDQPRPHVKRFRYEAAWSLRKECEATLKEAWVKPIHERAAAETIRSRLTMSATVLRKWNEKVIRKAPKEIRQKLKALEELQELNKGDQLDSIRKLKGDIDQDLAAEDLKWKQRAKQHWLQNGDRNTTFYHLHASHRRKINKISQIMDHRNCLISEKDQVGRVITRYFSDLFTSSSPSGIEDCIKDMPNKVSTAMNELLLQEFTEEEVKNAVFQMKSMGSPGPDGFPACFFQTHWNTTGKEVSRFVLNILNTAGSLEGVNDTYITLIPKIKNPTKVSDYRPISLCNVIYKVVAKVLSNRLKLILPDIISVNQSAFVPGRAITDNIMVAYETLHSMSTRIQGKSAYMALKLDMSKAYDRVEWDFLEVVMCKMGFDRRWVTLVMNCIRSVSYSVLLNGEAQSTFKPTRGLRQGDPISPYLFIICAEALSNLLTQAESKGKISSIPMGRGPTKINHLFFADDSMIFCKASTLEWRRMLGMLTTYEQASGQLLNKEKSAIYFSRNTTSECRANITRIAGVTPTASFGKYLGLPAMVGRTKVACFHGLIDRMWSKINNWKTDKLSVAGKEVLLKSVLQAIPTYTMGIFLLPKSITKRLDQMLRKFWWGFSGDQTKMQWIKWSRINKAKDQGGLGFRDFNSFNMALLAKNGWNLLQSPTSLPATILRQKYFPHGSILKAKVGARPSLAWRSLHAGLSLLKEGLLWRIGDGKQVRIWEDRWLPRPHFLAPRIEAGAPTQRNVVADLINPSLRTWNDHSLHEMFTQQDIEVIKTVPITLGSRGDRLIWGCTQNGLFSVKSGYHLHQEIHANPEAGPSKPKDQSELWKGVWKLQVPNGVKVFIWRACNEGLPTLANLKRRKIVAESTCPICGRVEETADHALWSCSAARDVWCQASKPIQKLSLEVGSFKEVWQQITDKLPAARIEEVGSIMRLIWTRRNEVVHGKAFRHPNSILVKAQDDLYCYKLAIQGRVSCRAAETSKCPQKWITPPVGEYKLNWDAAINQPLNQVGIGAIIRDCNGQVLGTMRARRELNLSPFTAEAYALMMAVIFCKEAGFRSIIFEGDSLKVVEGMQKKAKDWSQGGLIIEDTKLLLQDLVRWKFCHTKRDSNMAAHLLAKNALLNDCDLYELEEIPPCIRRAVILDVCNSMI
ncbi:uncharacterized protein LOC122306468 [Carya illinoinensis]|uniref:uncharacterized protein LOC122306468 n=1 Tax=Carya illinoinensis TaxID=32201 RepID=UPI001C7247C9|nr:uncharacterized protein LOC122306468 [Carya illinoinensis]